MAAKAFKVPPASTDPLYFQRDALEQRMRAFGDVWMIADKGLLFCKECSECQHAGNATQVFDHYETCPHAEAPPARPWLTLFNDLARYRAVLGGAV